jgi:signal transduction histidine kinase
LLDNAIKFTADGGEIKVHLSSDAQFFKLVVEDFGAGIEKDVQSTLFQPFTQGPTGRRYTLGSGLGLYLCRQIVEAHQGRITCESELGRGSKFTVLLPCTKNGV